MCDSHSHACSFGLRERLDTSPFLQPKGTVKATTQTAAARGASPDGQVVVVEVAEGVAEVELGADTKSAMARTTLGQSCSHTAIHTNFQAHRQAKGHP